MRILRRAWSYEPRSTSEVGILSVKLHGSILWVLPQSPYPIECVLLNGAIVCIGGARSPEPDDRARMRSVRGVREEIPSEIIQAVINSERILRSRFPFETNRTRS